MGMKVYLSGDNVIVEKTATATLTIPRSRAKFRFISVEDNDPNSVTTFSNVEVSDIIIFSNVRNDTLANIQYQGGGAVGTYEEIVKYFSTFFPLGDSIQKKNDIAITGNVTVTGGATAANQVLEIEAIEAISEKILPLNFDAFARLRVSNPNTIFDSTSVLLALIFRSSVVVVDGAIAHHPPVILRTSK